MVASATPLWLRPRKWPISWVATLCRSKLPLVGPAVAVRKVAAGLNRMSASTISPGSRIRSSNDVRLVKDSVGVIASTLPGKA